MGKVIAEVCKKYDLKCEKSPFPVRVGSVSHLFCCQQGYEKSVIEFGKTVKPANVNI